MCHLVVIFLSDDVCMLILLMYDGFIKLKWFHTLGFFPVKLLMLSCQIKEKLFETREPTS